MEQFKNKFNVGQTVWLVKLDLANGKHSISKRYVHSVEKKNLRENNHAPVIGYKLAIQYEHGDVEWRAESMIGGSIEEASRILVGMIQEKITELMGMIVEVSKDIWSK